MPYPLNTLNFEFLNENWANFERKTAKIVPKVWNPATMRIKSSQKKNNENKAEPSWPTKIHCLLIEQWFAPIDFGDSGLHLSLLTLVDFGDGGLYLSLLTLVDFGEPWMECAWIYRVEEGGRGRPFFEGQALMAGCGRRLIRRPAAHKVRMYSDPIVVFLGLRDQIVVPQIVV
jgi:hypothetical protein